MGYRGKNNPFISICFNDKGLKKEVDALQRKLDFYVDIVEDFGADPTGVKDSSLNIQNALDYAKTNNIPAVRADKGTFKLLSPIKFYSGITFYGMGRDTVFDGSALPVGKELREVKLFKIEGAIGTASTPLSTNAYTLEGTLNVVSSTGFSKEDLVILTNDEPYAQGTTNTGLKKGELHIVDSVPSDTSLELKDMVIFNYDVTRNTLLRNIKPIENVILRDFSIVMGGVGTAHNAIYCNFTRNICVDNVVIDKAEDTAIAFFNSYNPIVRNCTVYNSTSPSSIGNTGYGISLMDTCRESLVERNTFYNCRHGVAGGGTRPSILAMIQDNKAFGNKLAFPFDCHEPCFYWTFSRNLTDGCYGGFAIRGQYITVDNNLIFNSTGEGIRVESYTAVSSQFGIVITNNRIKNCAGIGIDLDGYQGRIRESSVKGNTIDGAQTKGINVYNFSNVEVCDNSVINIPNGWGIYAGGTTGNRSSDLVLNNNRVSYTGKALAYLEYIDRSDINGGKYRQSSKEGMYCNSCNELQINGSSFRASTLYGIHIVGGNKHQLSNVRCSLTTDTNGDGMRIESATDVNINGGIIDNNPRFGIYITGSDYVLIKGVNARNNTNATKISVDETAVNKIIEDNFI
ncbi:hypothetical protein BEH_11815 [Priestia filamentosa]|uniref:Right handed beta helix domain-containing protein n=1 Tax=Priestia filamentosa TaxID=1402861 RepID=A0A2S1LZF1_9BACI|nr:right-handed parallel beta-helix repeat-containing protein [Priestia filamentosa]AWG44186.1 hypothetical protein BEH_11815 [Priestia filamentosa]